MTSPHRPPAQPPKTATTFSNNTPTNPRTPPPPPSLTATQPQPAPMPLPPWVEKRLAALPSEIANPLRQRLENLAHLQTHAESLRVPIQTLVISLFLQAEDEVTLGKAEAGLRREIEELRRLGHDLPSW